LLTFPTEAQFRTARDHVRQINGPAYIPCALPPSDTSQHTGSQIPLCTSTPADLRQARWLARSYNTGGRKTNLHARPDFVGGLGFQRFGDIPRSPRQLRK
jgi:hypothetical protein